MVRHATSEKGWNVEAQRLGVTGGGNSQAVGSVPSQVPWRRSVSARVAWDARVSCNMLSKVLKTLSVLRWQGTPTRAHLQLPETESCNPEPCDLNWL